MFEYLVLIDGQSFIGEREIRIEVDGDKLKYRLEDRRFYILAQSEERTVSGIYEGDQDAFIRKLESFDVPHWKNKYYIPACDGYFWDLRYKEVGKPCRKITGSNDCPDCFEEFVDLMFSVTGDMDRLIKEINQKCQIES